MDDKAMGNKGLILGRRGFLMDAVVAGLAGVVASSRTIAKDQAMKITSVDIYQTAKDPKDATKPIVVRLNTDAGISGFGEVGLAYGAGHNAGFGMLKDLAGYVIGLDPRNVESIWEKLFRSTFWGMGGGPVVYGGISAIDTACWDIRGKEMGVPIYRLLGGKTREKLRTYASQLQLGWGKRYTLLIEPEEYAEVALKAVSEGYDCLKVDPVCVNRKGEVTSYHGGILSHPEIKLAYDRIKAMRDAVGPDVDIMIELHSGYGLNSAIQFGNAIEDLKCMCYEEPVHPMNVDNFALLARSVKIPLAGGERIYTRWGYRPFFEKQALALIQPDIGLVGGFTECKKICDMAHVYDATVQCHVAGGPIATAAALQMEAAIPNFIVHEYHVAAMNETLIATCKYDYLPEKGSFTPPELPGIGQELTERTMAECDHVRIG
jgi:galactonate dehydratase